jgi:hypothetical protein
MTAADVCKITGQAIRLLLSGELKAREASALAQLCNSLYRFIPTADLETRVATLEEQVAQEESGGPPEADLIGSPTNELVPAAESDVLLPAGQIQCPTNPHTPGWTDGGEGTESGSHEPEEGEEA